MGLTEALFYFSAAFALASAAAVLASRNTVYAALYFVAHLLSVAVLYAFLKAPLIAVLQVMVYAGAVMILFVFAVMILDASVLPKLDWRKETAHWVCGILLALGLALSLSGAFHRFDLKTVLAPPSGQALPATVENVAGVARLLFRENLFAFELVGILLLVAVVAIMVMAKRRLDA